MGGDSNGCRSSRFSYTRMTAFVLQAEREIELSLLCGGNLKSFFIIKLPSTSFRLVRKKDINDFR